MKEELFRATLALGVPLEMQRLSRLPVDLVMRKARRIEATDLHADDALFGGRNAAQGMSNLIRALALLAYAEGGVRFAGLHWCTNHQVCIEAGAA